MGKISKMIQKSFSNVFMVIVAQGNEYVIRYIAVKKGKILKNEEKNFPMIENKKLSPEMIKFISSIEEEYKFVYIAYLLDTLGQNCLPTCNKDDFLSYHINKDKVVSVCVNKKWSVCSLKSDIKWVEELFDEVGIDFIFSPFLILNNFIRNKKRRIKSNLFILYSENFVSLMIFDADKAVFGVFFKIPHKEFDFNSEDDEDLKPEENESSIDGIELDSIESEDEEFEGFVDIAKLDDDEEEEDIQQQILDSAKEEVNSSTLEDLELYGRDVIIFKFINSAIKEYYENEIYDSEFLEEVIIYNDSNISNDIITMIESDLFLDVELHSIDIKEEMINMSIKEADL